MKLRLRRREIATPEIAGVIARMIAQVIAEIIARRNRLKPERFRTGQCGLAR